MQRGKHFSALSRRASIFVYSAADAMQQRLVFIFVSERPELAEMGVQCAVEWGGSTNVVGCRSQRGQSARRSVRQRTSAARLHAPAYRRAGAQRRQAVRHLQNAAGASIPASRLKQPAYLVPYDKRSCYSLTLACRFVVDWPCIRYFASARGVLAAGYCDEYVCLFVCLLTQLESDAAQLYQIFVHIWAHSMGP